MQIGQEVVAIISHRQGLFKKGEAYVVKNIRQGCKHNPTLIDIGKHIRPENFSFCRNCDFKVKAEAWFDAKDFIPVDYSNAKQVTFEKIVEKVPMFANTLLIFAFLSMSFVVKPKYIESEKRYVYNKVSKHLKTIINNPKNFENVCTCPF